MAAVSQVTGLSNWKVFDGRAESLSFSLSLSPSLIYLLPSLSVFPHSIFYFPVSLCSDLFSPLFTRPFPLPPLSLCTRPLPLSQVLHGGLLRPQSPHRRGRAPGFRGAVRRPHRQVPGKNRPPVPPPSSYPASCSVTLGGNSPLPCLLPLRAPLRVSRAVGGGGRLSESGRWAPWAGGGRRGRRAALWHPGRRSVPSSQPV